LQEQEEEEEDEEEITFVTDTIGDESLQPLEQDYIALPFLESKSDDSTSSNSREEAFDSDSEKEISYLYVAKHLRNDRWR
jgi:hypothetical protein